LSIYACYSCPLVLLFQAIYDEEISAEGFDAAEVLTKETARKAMQEARVSAIPPCPNSMADAVQKLSDGTLPAKIQDLYLDHVTWTEKKGSRSTQHFGVLLGDRELFNKVANVSTFTFADGTFKITPRTARNVSARGAQVIAYLSDYQSDFAI